MVNFIDEIKRECLDNKRKECYRTTTVHLSFRLYIKKATYSLVGCFFDVYFSEIYTKIDRGKIGYFVENMRLLHCH